MVDGEGHGGGRRDVARCRDLLEIGLQREGEREEKVVDDVKHRRHHDAPAEPVDAAIGQKDRDQPDIFEDQRVAFAEPADGAAHIGRGDHVDEVVDKEQRGHLIDAKAEAFNHHEGREDDEDLSPRARHELQQVVKPVALAQDEMLQLRVRRLEPRIGEGREKDDGDGQPARGRIDHLIAEVEGLPGQHDQPIGHHRRARSDGDDPADRLRRLGPVDPLQLQRLVHRLEIVKPDRGQKRDDKDAAKAGEQRRHRRRRPQKRQRQKRERLFAEQPQKDDHPDGKKARYLTHRVKPADLHPGEARGVLDEIVQKRRPGGERQRHRRRHEEQKRRRPPPAGQRPGLFDCHGPPAHGPAYAGNPAEASGIRAPAPHSFAALVCAGA